MRKPWDLFPRQVELPFPLPDSSGTPPQTMHSCPSTVVPTPPSSFRMPLEAMPPPPTGRPKWKRSHQQPAFLLERLSSGHTGGETATAWGCSPLQQEEYKGFMLQLGHLTREVPGHPGSSAYAPKQANGPGFIDSSLIRPIGPLSSNQCAECAQWKSAESERGKFQPHSYRVGTPRESQCALALHKGTEL